MSKPDLITLVLSCYDSTRIRDSESATSLFYALRVKPGNFDRVPVTDYFAVTAALLENYPAAVETIGVQTQMGLFLQYVQPPACRSVSRALVLQFTVGCQVRPTVRDSTLLREKYHFHQLI